MLNIPISSPRPSQIPGSVCISWSASIAWAKALGLGPRSQPWPTLWVLPAVRLPARPLSGPEGRGFLGESPGLKPPLKPSPVPRSSPIRRPERPWSGREPCSALIPWTQSVWGSAHRPQSLYHSEHSGQEHAVSLGAAHAIGAIGSITPITPQGSAGFLAFAPRYGARHGSVRQASSAGDCSQPDRVCRCGPGVPRNPGLLKPHPDHPNQDTDPPRSRRPVPSPDGSGSRFVVMS